MKNQTIIALLLSGAVSIGVACSSSSTSTNDMGSSSNEDLSKKPSDGAEPLDFAKTNECAPVETWCNANSPCPKTWASANKAETWCTAGVTAGIYITKSQACDAGYFAVAFVSDSINPTGRQYGYATTTSGNLVSVGSYYPDDVSGDFTCVAGPVDAAQAIASSGCEYTQFNCVNGVLQ